MEVRLRKRFDKAGAEEEAIRRIYLKKQRDAAEARKAARAAQLQTIRYRHAFSGFYCRNVVS
jgi:hypothetical protein